MDKLTMHSPNLTEDNIARMRDLFPGCVTETRGEDGSVKLAVDFDQLRQELSASIVEGPQERYQLNWPGKREALLTANAPIAKTLRPARDESVDFDTTKNLFIEGDNLDALKLLQETYLGKIKMIYIDPPYNTGDDFIYEDDYAEDTQSFLVKSNQKDEVGNRMVANSASDGRYHSDWLGMMYPRLRLAKNLLKDEGLIFISIGDEELANLRELMDEIFGRENFEGHIHWRRRSNQPNDPTKMIGLVAEHILAYARDKAAYKASGVGKIGLTGSFRNPDNDSLGDWASKPWKAGSDQSGSRYKIVTPTGKEYDEEWMGEENTYKELHEAGRIIFPDKGNGAPRKKYYKFKREREGQCANNWWTPDQFGSNQDGNAALTELMDGIKNVFSNPKPPKLISNLISIANCKDNDIVLDFFLGSATTFQAAYEYDANLHVIGVQYPEILTAEKKEHLPALELLKRARIGRNTIAEISKERIRRVGQRMSSEQRAAGSGQRAAGSGQRAAGSGQRAAGSGQRAAGSGQRAAGSGQRAAGSGQLLDTKFPESSAKPEKYSPNFGFRVLKIDTSNMADIFYTPDALDKSNVDMFVNNIKPDRTAEDLLFQVMLDWGVDLALPIQKNSIQGKDVFFVDSNALAACFDAHGGVDEAFVKELATHKPLRVVFRDAGFKDSAVKINVEQIFKLLSPATDVKSI